MAPTTLRTLCCALVAGALFGPSQSRAQDHGTILSTGMKPYTETVRDMVRRDRATPKPPKTILVLPEERELDNEALVRKVPDAVPHLFQPPAFRGNRIGIESLGAGFRALGLSDENGAFGSGFIPPDTTGAIGPNHFVEILNGGVAIYNRIGVRLSLVSMTSFFAVPNAFPTSGAITGDPRLFFDRRSQRWFACAFDGAKTNNLLCFAISRTTDPTGSWDKYVFVLGDYWDFGDWPTMGTDDNGVYFAANELPTDPNGQAHARIFATPKETLISPSPSMGTLYRFDYLLMWSAPIPPLVQDPVAPTDPAWFFSSSWTVFGNVIYYTLTWSAGVPTLSGVGALTTPAYPGLGPHAPSKGSTALVETGDHRLLMGTIRNHQLWTCRNIGVDATGSGSTADRCACEWLQIDLSGGSPVLVQAGRIWDPSASDPRFYYYPAVEVNGQGHAAIAFSGSKSSEYISAYGAQRLAGDAAGTMGAITTIQSGGNAYYVDFGSGRVRWGDYTLMSVDPNDDMTLWTVQEYATSSMNIWGTWVTPISSPAPTLNNPVGSGFQGATGVTLNLTGTGLYDPGAGFPNRLIAVLNGGVTNGISNYAVKYNGPASVTLKFDIAAGASTGTRDLTLTNPDGQAVKVTKAFTVNAPHVTKLVVAAASGQYSGKATLTATLTAGTAGLSGRTISFKVDGNPGGTAVTNAVGVGSLVHTCTEAPGTHLLTAAFAGDVADAASSATGDLSVTKAATAVIADTVTATAGSSVTYGATLIRTTDNTAISGKPLQFYDTATNTLLGTGSSNLAGRATTSITAPAKGIKKSITVKFLGDSAYLPKTVTGSITGR